jgi:hypothetical protein
MYKRLSGGLLENLSTIDTQNLAGGYWLWSGLRLLLLLASFCQQGFSFNYVILILTISRRNSISFESFSVFILSVLTNDSPHMTALGRNVKELRRKRLWVYTSVFTVRDPC